MEPRRAGVEPAAGGGEGLSSRARLLTCMLAPRHHPGKVGERLKARWPRLLGHAVLLQGPSLNIQACLFHTC